jgi:hypothetical protein
MHDGSSCCSLDVQPGVTVTPFVLQGVDWRDPRAQGCNAGRNPIQESFYDGVNADPLEVLFVKVKASMHQARWQHVLQVASRSQAATYSCHPHTRDAIQYPRGVLGSEVLPDVMAGMLACAARH